MKANCSLQHNHSGPVVRTSWIAACPHWLPCFHFPALCFCSEKEKRVKSSSDGEGASSSQSDSSASQGSLKGGGESRRTSSHLFLSSSFSLSLSLCRSDRSLKGRKSVQPLVKGWPTWRLQVSWWQSAFHCLPFLTNITKVNSRWHFKAVTCGDDGAADDLVNLNT